MKMRAKTDLPALLLGLSLAGSAWAGPSHHWHDVAPAAGHAAHSPAPGTMPVHGGGYWHNLPPAAAHGAYFASGGAGHYRHDWGHGDIHYFPYHDRDYWDHGGWYHTWYGGRFGWWWVVSGVWFFYPVPVYPYPDPYIPSDFVAPPPPEGAAAVQFWYFCPASNAYYPYVPACPTGWQQVPAAMAQPQPPNPPPPGG